MGIPQVKGVQSKGPAQSVATALNLNFKDCARSRQIRSNRTGATYFCRSVRHGGQTANSINKFAWALSAMGGRMLSSLPACQRFFERTKRLDKLSIAGVFYRLIRPSNA